MRLSIKGKSGRVLKHILLLTFLTLLSMTLISCSTDDGSSSGGSDSDIPDGAIWPDETMRVPYPPSDYSAVVVWGQSPTMKRDTTETAYVEIDYMRVVERDAFGNETIVTSEEYNDGPRSLTEDEGGLYVRGEHWFSSDYHIEMYNSEISNGVLTINSVETPDNIPHFWTRRVTLKSGCRYYVRARVRVTGEAALQFGSDWWRTLTAIYIDADGSCIRGNNCEAWISYWITDTGGEFIIVEVPIN